MKFIIGFLITIGLLILVFVLIFRAVTGNDAPAPANLNLVSYANSSSITMEFVDKGPVQADQTHDEVRITVGSGQTTMEVFQGYEGNLQRTQSYANNSTAYADFLRALQLNGFNNGNTDKKVADDRGYCAVGHRYIFTVKDGDKQKQRFWSSSCNVGSLKAKSAPLRALFVAQVPDYNTLIRGTF